MRSQAVLIDAILTLSVLLKPKSPISLALLKMVDLCLDEQLGLDSELQGISVVLLPEEEIGQ